MFRVPSDAAAPSFDETFKVGFLQWLTSSKADRQEWMTRRNIAARLAATNQNQRIDEKYAISEEQRAAVRAELRAQLEAMAATFRAEFGARRRRRRR